MLLGWLLLGPAHPACATQAQRVSREMPRLAAPSLGRRQPAHADLETGHAAPDRLRLYQSLERVRRAQKHSDAEFLPFLPIALQPVAPCAVRIAFDTHRRATGPSASSVPSSPRAPPTLL